MLDFQGKVVLVTGASRGIGAAIAQAFAARGAAVAVNYLNRHDAAQSVVQACRAAGGDAVALAADVTAPVAATDLVQRTVAEFGRLDVLVNNAFAPYAFDPEQRRPVDALAWPDFQRQFEGAVGAAFHLCRAALPHLRRDAQGAIVNIVSDLVEDPVVPYPDYATAKSALVGFSRQLAAELGPQGVRVNCVAPGLVQEGRAGAAAELDHVIAGTGWHRGREQHGVEPGAQAARAGLLQHHAAAEQRVARGLAQ